MIGFMKFTLHTKHRSAWLRAICLFFLVATVVLAIPSQPKKEQIPKAGTEQAGYSDTSTLPGVPGIRKLDKGAVDPDPYDLDPHTAYPPYAPVAMRPDFGVTGLTTYNNTNGIALIDPSRNVISPILLNAYDYTVDPVTHQPIGGPLGSEGGGRFDVVINQAGTLAAVSNFGDSTVYFVNLSSGTPVVDGKVDIDFFAEDLVMDPSEQWLLVTDGGFSPVIARIHIPTRTLVPFMTDDDDDPSTPDVPGPWRFPSILVDDDHDPSTPDVEAPAGYANAIAVAADGRTVVCADYFQGNALVVLLDPATGNLTYRQRFELWREGTGRTDPYPFMYRPVNVSISPDGRTVLFANASDCLITPDDSDPDDPNQHLEGCNIGVLRIDSPGQCTRMPDVIMPYSVKGGQSIAFSRDGGRAYYETIYWPLNAAEDAFNANGIHQEIQVLSVNGPGLVTRSGAIPTPTIRGTSQLFGVECLATSPDGNFLYVTNPTVSGGQPVVDVIDLNRQQAVKQITCPLDYPDPMRDPYPDPPGPPDPGDTHDWIATLIPTGIAFPEGPIDLGLQIQLDQTQASLGEEFTFRLVVTNGSVSPAFGVRVASLLPEGVEIVSASPDRGSWDAAAGRWSINGLRRGGTATLTVTAKASTQGDKLLSGKINGQAGYDPRTANNRAEATIQISLPADLALTAVPTSGSWQTQVAFPVELTARNLGPKTAERATVTQNLPAGWSVSGATASRGAYDAATGIWTVGELAVDASATLKLQLKGTSEGTATLQFAIDDSVTGDPVESNNQALVTLTLVKAAPPLLAKVERLTNDLVFTKEYVNQLSWQHNPINVSFTGYRIRRKTKGAADSSYELLAEVGATVTQYADRQRSREHLFTYKITAVTSRGEESQPAIVGN